MSDDQTRGAGPGRNVSTMPSRTAVMRLEECKTLQQAFQTKDLRDRIAAAVPKHLDPDTMLRTFIQAASRQPLIYQCDMRQALGAFMSLTYLGLPPNTPLGLSHLIPFKTRRKQGDKWVDGPPDLTLIIGYPGYVDLAYRSGMVKSIHSDVVLPGERFRAEHGSHKILEHTPELDHDTSDATPRAAYAFVKLTDDDEFEVMPWAEVIKVRNRSQAFQTADRAREAAATSGGRAPRTWTEAPWVRDEREMGKKTAFRRLAKWLPRSPELRAAANLEDGMERNKLDFGAVIEGKATPWDGIPEQTDAPEDRPADPGAAYGLRSGEPDDYTLPAGAVTHPDPAPVQESVEPGFEAVLIDQFGTPIEGTFFTAEGFARALVELHQRAQTDDEQAAIAHHNADAIVEAQTNPAALKILMALEAPRLVDTATNLPVITPPHERGRTDWRAYAKAVQAGIGGVPPDRLDAWCELQRPYLAEAVMASRALAVRAILNAYRPTGRPAPAWLAELTRPPEAQAPAGPSEADFLGWVDGLESDLDAITEEGHFETLVSSESWKRRLRLMAEADSNQWERAVRLIADKRNSFGPPPPEAA